MKPVFLTPGSSTSQPQEQNKLLLFKPPNLQHFVMAAQAD